MKEIQEFLKGKKSYIIAFGVACVAFSLQMGWVEMSTAVTLYGLLGAGSVASLRAGMNN